ncbi:MAG TPA: transporter [Eubacteriaceae bacterium]|nr:transporter [Eubacteriaceae bacterium]
MNFYNMFVAIATLFILGAVGYLIRKKDVLKDEANSNIPKLITEVTLPCLIISSMQIEYTWDKVADMGLMLLVGVVAFVIQYGFVALIPGIFGLADKHEKGIYQFMVMFQNSGFIGIPVLATIFGEEAIFFGAIYIIPYRVLIMTLGVKMMDSRIRKFNYKELLNPGMAATVIGLFLFFTQIKLTDFINQPLEIVGGLTTPLAMLFIGASMIDLKFEKIFVNKRMYIISFIRLLAIPIILLIVIKGFVTNEIARGVPVIIHAMPVATLCTIFAKEYDNNVDLASSGVFMTTLLSMVTIPIVATLLLMV